MRNKLSGLLVALVMLGGPGVVLGFAPADVEPEPPTAVPVPPSWKAVAASGLVEALPARQTIEEWVRVQRGDQLVARTAVRTGRRGWATLIHGASIVLVDPNSRIALPASSATAETNKVIQEYGSVLYEVDGASNPGFRVVTPQLVAGVKGTVFMVSVTDTHATVTVREGVVEVTSQRTGVMQEVRAGETLLVDVEETEAMEVVSSRDRLRSSAIGTRKETARVVRVESRRFDRALNRLSADLADSGLPRSELAGNGEIASFLHGRGDRADLIDALADGEDIVIQIGDLDDDSREELILDLDNEETKTLEEQEDPGSVAVPNQPLP